MSINHQLQYKIQAFLHVCPYLSIERGLNMEQECRVLGHQGGLCIKGGIGGTHGRYPDPTKYIGH